MAAEKEATYTIRSATDERAQAATSAVQDTAKAVVAGTHEVADQVADTTRKLTETSSRQFDRLVNDSARASQATARRVNGNLDVLLQAGSVVSSSYQSILSEWSKYARNAARRNAETVNKLLKVRNPGELVSIQGDYVREGVQSLLSVSARVAELSVEATTKAVDKLNARTGA